MKVCMACFCLVISVQHVYVSHLNPICCVIYYLGRNTTNWLGRVGRQRPPNSLYIHTFARSSKHVLVINNLGFGSQKVYLITMVVLTHYYMLQTQRKQANIGGGGGGH